jgi:hypothetical protein
MQRGGRFQAGREEPGARFLECQPLDVEADDMALWRDPTRQKQRIVTVAHGRIYGQRAIPKTFADGLLGQCRQ